MTRKLTAALGVLICCTAQANAQQLARPSSTINNSGWSATGAATLHEATDETTPNGDTDRASATTTGDNMELGLSAITDPRSSSGHLVRITAQAVGSGAGERLSATLKEGAATVATVLSNQTVSRTDYTLYTYTLTPAEADSITNYAALSIQFQIGTIGGGESIKLTQTELETPNQPPLRNRVVIIGERKEKNMKAFTRSDGLVWEHLMFGCQQRVRNLRTNLLEALAICAHEHGPGVGAIEELMTAAEQRILEARQKLADLTGHGLQV